MGLSAALLCVALTVYHEARGESVAGQLAVANVVHNRAGGDPKKYCQVVRAPISFHGFVNRGGSIHGRRHGGPPWRWLGSSVDSLTCPMGRPISMSGGFAQLGGGGSLWWLGSGPITFTRRFDMGVTFRKVSGVDVFAQAEAVSKALGEAVGSVKKLLLGKGSVSVEGDSVLVECPKSSVKEVLAAIGMTTATEAPEPLKPSGKKSFCAGDRVVVTSSMFPWVKAYNVGDTGVVSKVHSPVKEAVQYGDRYAMVEVRLDSGKKVILSVCEIDHVGS